jgi:ketosteroid isomerase-like protein
MKTFGLFVFLVFSISYLAAQDIHEEINTFINNWHTAASQANAKVFFESMADNCIYIGTDAGERWNKAEFLSFSKPYFDKGKAWDFKPSDRDLHVTSDAKIAWFSELLTTWMGVCRGSGILIKSEQGWKIAQYHLSVTVPNDLMKDFINLIETKATR